MLKVERDILPEGKTLENFLYRAKVQEGKFKWEIAQELGDCHEKTISRWMGMLVANVDVANVDLENLERTNPKVQERWRRGIEEFWANPENKKAVLKKNHSERANNLRRMSNLKFYEENPNRRLQLGKSSREAAKRRYQDLVVNVFGPNPKATLVSLLEHEYLSFSQIADVKDISRAILKKLFTEYGLVDLPANECRVRVKRSLLEGRRKIINNTIGSRIFENLTSLEQKILKELYLGERGFPAVRKVAKEFGFSNAETYKLEKRALHKISHRRN